MHLFGNYSYTEVERKFGTIIPTLKTWISSYRTNGIDELQISHTWRICRTYISKDNTSK